MNIAIAEPATGLQQTLKVHKYYTNKCNELVIFDKIRKGEEK